MRHIPSLSVLPAVRRDLDRHRSLGPAQRVHQFGLVHDTDELRRALLDHLLPQQGSAPPLHEVELGVHLVRAIDSDIEHRVRGNSHLVAGPGGGSQGVWWVGAVDMPAGLPNSIVREPRNAEEMRYQ